MVYNEQEFEIVILCHSSHTAFVWVKYYFPMVNDHYQSPHIPNWQMGMGQAAWYTKVLKNMHSTAREELPHTKYIIL